MSEISMGRGVRLSYVFFKIFMLIFILSPIFTGLVQINLNTKPLYLTVGIPFVLFILIILSFLIYNRPKTFVFLGENRELVSEIMFLASVVLFFVLPFLLKTVKLNWEGIWIKLLIMFGVLVLAYIVRVPAFNYEEELYKRHRILTGVLPHDVPNDLNTRNQNRRTS